MNSETRALTDAETELLMNGLHMLWQQRFRWQPTLDCSDKRNQDIKEMERLLKERRVVIRNETVPVSLNTHKSTKIERVEQPRND